MFRTQHFTRKASMAAAGVALALGAGVASMGPAQATAAPTAETKASSADSAPQGVEQAALVRSTEHPTTYFLKVPNTNGPGELPAPHGIYDVSISSGGQYEQHRVEVKDGVVDLKDSHILQTARFDPYISITWVGEAH
ncbi:hypothetical protein [Kocuria sp. HSID16901]|uniref:hypothetical protein n=1 Tax=Kocuria sp. HSID16901 TaxID=2419505 RepID=UPI0006610807|nr:hypothetical protein [Kocuria sp. HSID16901]MCT1367708.1 hypothetical protein [Rothia sp. p3-SID1597]RUQ20265.1 hypothetical protein D8M21_09840 [Kocuria sp. HSID16901]